MTEKNKIDTFFSKGKKGAFFIFQQRGQNNPVYLKIFRFPKQSIFDMINLYNKIVREDSFL